MKDVKIALDGQCQRLIASANAADLRFVEIAGRVGCEAFATIAADQILNTQDLRRSAAHELKRLRKRSRTGRCSFG